MELPYSEVQITHWNPGATMPLQIPVTMICNTSDEQLQENVRASTGRRLTWLRESKAHRGTAIMCGSGPSLSGELQEIVERREAGAVLFAMNGAAAYLACKGVLPDYQVIVDARPDTAVLVGPAKQHLIASQCAPETFDRAGKNAILWHQEIGGIEDFFDPVNADRGYALIGGAGSVGNSALCVAYAMGFREFHLYGYDSSHRDGESHAFDQPLNNGEPCAWITFRGKRYLCSLTMKLQAERFMGLTAPALKEAGCMIVVHGSGLLPDMYHAPPLSEVEKYQEIWSVPGYRKYSPGEEAAEEFIEVAGITSSHTVVDFGCGTGRGALAIKYMSGAAVTLVDFADNCRDEEAKSLPFMLADISVPGADLPQGDVGFCCDVMEHLPPESVPAAIANIMAAVPRCFFRIATVPDSFGAVIGQPLHLSVHDGDQWARFFFMQGCFVEDLHDDAVSATLRVSRNG